MTDGVLILVTHPEVLVDPAVPVTRWGLSDHGRARMARFAASPVLAGVSALWSSDETKAVEAATLVAHSLGLPVRQHPDLGENDRSATGFLPQDVFESTADAFFARPGDSVQGWERAVDAQARIVRAVTEIVAGHGAGDLAIISHGAVGTLLAAALQGAPISRALDQPFQGHYWRASLSGLRMQHGWLSIR